MKLLYAIIACCLLISYTTISQSISSNAPLCGNANLTLELTATGGSTYAWKGPNSFTSTQQKPNIKNVNYQNRGVYTVTVDNKTVLTIEVKILDPVAFTVPKEISVCEGGTLIIEPKSARLTDSTEVADSYGFYDFQNNNVPNGIIENFSKKNIGNYQITGYPYSFTNSTDYGCISNQIINVKLSSNSNCKIKRIDIDDLTKIKICDNKEIIIPFKTIGDFPQGTKFKIYILGSGEGFNKPIKPDFILEKSPVIISQIPWYALHSFVPGIRILIIADDADKTTAITPFRTVTGVKEYLPNKINTTIACDSVKLFMVGNYSNYSAIDSVQWFLDGKSIKGAYKPTFFAKNSGTYTFKIKQYLNPIDNFCIYEGSPLLVETKKIEKPIIYKYGDYELCANKPIYLETPQTKSTTYRWKLDGNYILGATNTIYQTIQSGKYQVEAKESSCISISDVVEVKKPESNYRFDFYLYNCFREKLANNSYKLCKNQSFDIVLRQYPTNARLQCFRNNIIIKDTIGNYLSGLKGEGKYFVKVIYGECEEISSTITIQYGESLKINYSSRNYCEGQFPVLDISSKELEKPNTKSYKYYKDIFTKTVLFR